MSAHERELQNRVEILPVRQFKQPITMFQVLRIVFFTYYCCLKRMNARAFMFNHFLLWWLLVSEPQDRLYYVALSSPPSNAHSSRHFFSIGRGTLQINIGSVYQRIVKGICNPSLLYFRLFVLLHLNSFFPLHRFITHFPPSFTDSELVYWNFFLDFGPLNLGQVRTCALK